MLIGDALGYPEVFAAVDPLTERLGRKVNPTIYSSQEFAKRVKRGDAFLRKVLEQSRIWLIGSDDVLAAR
jgi:hypothetical protein